MLKIFPIQSKDEQKEICERCGVVFAPDFLAYKATVDEALVGVCQFKLAPDGGKILDLSPVPNLPVDKEALFIMCRAALNFIDLCGVHRAVFDGDPSRPGEQLLHAIGFRRDESDILSMDLTDFFNSPCKHHSD